MAQQNAGNRTPNLSCRDCPTLRAAQWRVLTQAEVERLDRAKRTAAYSPGEPLFQQNSPCEGIHCFASGSVALRKTDGHGNSVLINLISEGSTIGYRCYYNSQHHAEEAEVLEPSTICLVPNNVLGELLAANPSLGEVFSQQMAKDLREMEQALLESVTLPVRGRVARLLRLLMDRFGEANETGEIVLRLPFGRQEMAELLGIQRETVTRTLNALQSDGVLAHTGRTLIVEDLDRLLDELEAE
ncbi:MAG TPA: Crp/Fnr family transcriptional regulator [bacterium]|nr:Crp/Fnr family transcriptional regulator [bacterium]